MATQLSFFKQLFPCSCGTCKSSGEVTHKITTTYYPNGKNTSPAWINVSLYCAECAESINKRSQDPIVSEYNDIKIELLCCTELSH